ncbi:prefoldin subunit beta [Patescibacteria group bacterium]|nr:prefoldin subunit beta [Patescibacteria group bacterium]
MEKGVQEKIAKLQGLEQNLQNFLLQRQQFQTQLMEIDSALDEIEKTDSAYKIVGNIMVKTGKEDLKKDLTQKKELMEIRITSLEKQESQLQEKAQELKDEVMKNLKKE